ncbi:MAG: sigma-E processing peptidase SpoIIGA [Clostridium chrysemydis]|uniref:sigma-E processing peptidase SpoIIGA n=1 Tax=Clostridium TaxID=1485 RepID=UPI002152573B|nr:sigma-E processing peptidase SpoIIGA [Clostridium sp. LY3-2]MCR6515900.1 sigma-E processing peptidase SpoIIGA [Clostridium sp. LY3-2]
MDIYIDVLILENSIVNLFLLTITYKILRIEYSFRNSFVISFLGSFYSLTMILDSLKIFSIFPIQLFVAIIMCYIPIKNKAFTKIIKATITFLGVSFVLSGICFKFMMESGRYTTLDGIYLSDFKVKYLILSIIIIYLTLDRIITLIKEKNIMDNFIFDLKINIGESEIKIKSFLDTGNELREPITNLPCVIIEKNSFKYNESENEVFYKIPYKAIGCEGYLKGIKVKSMQIRKGDMLKEFEGIVCLCDEKLSKENEFNALLSRGVL